MFFKKFATFALISFSLLVFACESAEENVTEIVAPEENTTEIAVEKEIVEKINVLATTPMIAEYVRQVGNDNIDLNILMPYSADPHSFEASPQDAKKIADADLVFYVGLKYESANLVELLENSVSSEDILIEIGPSIDPIEFSEEGHEGHDDHEGHDGHEGHDHGIYDPHFWFDPVRVSMAVEVIKDELIKNDSANESSYASAAASFVSELEALDQNVVAMFETIPVENRKIITTHEALGYLEAKYEIEVLTTIIPSLNSEDGITPKSLRNAIEVIEKNKIEVMFLEAESSSQYSEVIEQETGIALVSGLWVETLQENQSYVEWLENNVTIIVNNLPTEVHDDHDHDHDHDDHDDDDDDDDDDHDGHDHGKKDK